LALGLVLPVVVGLISHHPGPHAYAFEVPLTTGSGASTGPVYTSQAVAAPFTMAGLAWNGRAPDAVEYRVADAAGNWSPWRPLELSLDHAPDPGTVESTRQRTATEPIYVGVGTRIQFRFHGRIPRNAKAALVDTTSRTKPLVEQVLDHFSMTGAHAAVPQPAIHSRSEWDPTDECHPRVDPEEVQVTMAFVHHTATDRTYSQAEVPSMILGYCLYHRNVRGWDDVAYNFFVDRFGEIWEGRAGGIDKGIRGGHTKGFSSYSTGIALIGNYMNHAPSSPQQAALERLLAWKLALHNVDPTGTSTVVSKGSYKWEQGQTVTLPDIAGHRDAQATACPGTLCYNLLPKFRTDVAGMFTPLPADYYRLAVVGQFTGDTTEDGAAYRRSDGTWWVTDGTTGATSSTYDGTDGVTWDDAVAADLDGNGTDEVVVRSGVSVARFAGASSWSIQQLGRLGSSPSPAGPVVGDFTGSGKDAVVYEGQDGSLSVARAGGISAWGTTGGAHDHLLAGDFDGDGRDDLAAFGNDGTIEVVRSTGSTFAPPETWGRAPSTSGWQFVVGGDFDGDGRDDLAAFHAPTSTWWFFRSTGSAFTSAASVTRTSEDHWSTAFVTDGNGDGTNEIVSLDAYDGSWYQTRFDLPLAATVRLEDAPFRTTVERNGAPGGSRFLTWFGQEFNWVRTDVAYGAGRSIDAAERIAGASRYDTAALVSRRFFPDGAGTAFVVTGTSFPDALAGGPAAARLGAPILLTDPTALPASTADELRRLGAHTVYILGGPGAVSAAVEGQIAAIVPDVRRVAGADRYETAVAISEQFFSRAGTVYLATGEDFPDALSGTAAAVRDGAPMLLSLPDVLPEATRRELVRFAPAHLVVLGGTAAISDAVVADAVAATGATVERLAGSDRYATAQAVADHSFGAGTPIVIVATGENFPDATVAGAVAGPVGAPILLARSGGVPGPTRRELRRLRPRVSIILGGEGVLPAPVADEIRGFGTGAVTDRLAGLPRP